MSRPNEVDLSYIEYMNGSEPPVEQAVAPLLSFNGFADAGTFATDDGFYVGGVNAEQSAGEAFDRGDAQSFSIETVNASEQEQLLLVNRLGLAAGPAEDERLLLLFHTTGGEQPFNVPEGLWRVVQGGRQLRCRGSVEWQAEPCI